MMLLVVIWLVTCTAHHGLLQASASALPLASASAFPLAPGSSETASTTAVPVRHKSGVSHNTVSILDQEEEELDIWILPGEDILAEELSDNNAAKKPKGRRRRKRKIQHFLQERDDRKWPVPIFYQFHEKQPEWQRQAIRGALHHWQEKTCILFFEVNTGAALSTHHIKFTNYGKRCGSYVGRVEHSGGFTQAINLPEKCLKKFGTAVHEIGHALGLWHEHQRPDRDAHIRVVRDNLVYWAHHNFERALSTDVEHFGVPYDFNSVMHYGPRAGTNNGDATLRAVDPRYQSNIGQRVALSFLDAKVINTAYCAIYCAAKLPKACHHGGYQDPNDCGRCRCPDGLSGRYCQHVAPARGGQCGGEIELGDGEHKAISSPGFEDGEPYRNQVECNWVIRAPKGFSVQLEFVGNFSMFCLSGICYHWVEVRYKRSFEAPGPRFCCDTSPQGSLLSEGEEMLVTMRSNWTTEDRVARRGFKAYVTAKSRHLEDDFVEDTVPKVAPAETAASHNVDQSKSADDVTWSDWSKCTGHDCHCGGCSMQRRHRLCGSERCTGTEAQTEERRCSKVCTSADRVLFFAGRTYEYECPECCTGYIKEGYRCLPAS